MSTIDDLQKARAALYDGVWSWERNYQHDDPRRDTWTLYVNRGAPIDPSMPPGLGNMQHGLNVLGSADFDTRGEALRAFIVNAAHMVPELAAKHDAERKAWARLMRAAIDVRDATFAVEQAQAILRGGPLPPSVRDLAWARLVRATSRAETALSSGVYTEAVDEEYEAAKQALRDLGVDVDALLEE